MFCKSSHWYVLNRTYSLVLYSYVRVHTFFRSKKNVLNFSSPTHNTLYLRVNSFIREPTSPDSVVLFYLHIHTLFWKLVFRIRKLNYCSWSNQSITDRKQVVAFRILILDLFLYKNCQSYAQNEFNKPCMYYVNLTTSPMSKC